MAAVGTNQTWADIAAGIGDDGKTLKIVNMMASVNTMIADGHMQEGNTTTGHKASIESGIPTPTWTRLNKGVAKSKGTKYSVEFSSGMAESRSEVDLRLLKLAKDPAGYRLSQARSHMEGMAQELADKALHGNVQATPEAFTGLAAYYNDSTADSAENIEDAGGTGSDNTSLYLVTWQEDKVHFFYPSGTQAGIKHRAIDEEKVEDSDSNPFYAAVDLFEAHLGLVVADWRQCGRVANIDTTDLATAGAETDTSANMIRHAIRLKNKIWNLEGGRPYWYCNRTVLTALEIQAMNKPNVNLTLRDIGENKGVTMLAGIPVHRMDKITNAESQVTGL